MRNTKSEPILNACKNNIGNGYGQYCILDDGSSRPHSKKFPNDKIKIKIRTPIPSNEDLQLIELKNISRFNRHYHYRMFIAGLYIITAIIMGLEYWFCFKLF